MLCPRLHLKSKVGRMEPLSKPHSKLRWTRSKSIIGVREKALPLSLCHTRTHTHNLPHGIQESEKLQPLLPCKYATLEERLTPSAIFQPIWIGKECSCWEMSAIVCGVIKKEGGTKEIIKRAVGRKKITSRMHTLWVSWFKKYQGNQEEPSINMNRSRNVSH